MVNLTTCHITILSQGLASPARAQTQRQSKAQTQRPDDLSLTRAILTSTRCTRVQGFARSTLPSNHVLRPFLLPPPVLSLGQFQRNKMYLKLL